MGIRKAALIAGVAGTLGLLMPCWNAIRQIAAIGSQWVSTSLVVVTLLIGLTLPVFCITLYRNEGALRFPKRCRPLILTTAIVYALIVALGLPQQIGSLGPGARFTVLSADRDPWIMTDVLILLGIFSDLAWILLLIAFFRAGDEEDGDRLVSKGLRLASIAATIAWGLWLAFNVVRLVLTPYTYSQTRDYLAQIQRTPPEFRYMLADALRTLLVSACLFTAPFIVWRTSSANREAPSEDRADLLE